MAYILHLVNVPENARHGEVYADTQIEFGRFVTLNGTFSASDISGLPSTQRETPGYAYSGDLKVTQATAGVTGACFPINRVITDPQDADSTKNIVKAGQGCVYYTEGDFETDQFISGTDLKFGDYLKLTASGTLVPEAIVTTKTSASVARVIKKITNTTADRLWFRLLRE